MNKVKFVTENKTSGNKEIAHSSPLPSNICIVITILYYLKPFSSVIKLAEPLDNIGSDIERSSFLSLKNILSILESGKNEPINIYPFLDKFCHVANTTLSEFESLDISFVWDSIIKLITVVIPPLREVFLGKISSNSDIPSWLNLISRCFHAQFLHNLSSLDEVISSTLAGYDYHDDEDIDDTHELSHKLPATERIRNFNAKILYRAPEILVFAIESAHLPLALRFTDMFTKSAGKAKGPNAIRFPSSFDASNFINTSIDSKGAYRIPVSVDEVPELIKGNFSPNWYDLSAVVTLEGNNHDVMQAFYRCLDEEDSKQWFEGSAAHHDEVEPRKAIENNYFNISDNKKIHPRLLVYTKRGISSMLGKLSSYVTRSGQMRSMGDDTFDSATTPEHYDEAKHYYEQAIAYDEDLKPVLQERLNALDLIERNQRAQCYETQADISLSKRKFKEACDLYKHAIRSAVVNSPLHVRIREKEEYMMKIIALEIANHLTEKGQECLKIRSYVQGKEHFSQALKLNPSYIHLQTIITGIDHAITVQSSAQKVSEANQAMKIGKYKQANQLFIEAIALVPSREVSLKSVLNSLVVLMQGEEALSKQRAGLVALEDKKYALAIACITEAITLLPEESSMEHAFFLCDRAQVYFELKDYYTSIKDCNSALELRSDFAIAYLRLGAAQFELEQYDEATISYEKAIRNDPSLSDQVKVKVRQVNTAKEVLQRKEREAERLREKEEQKRLLEERRNKEEIVKKSRELKIIQEKAEKNERSRMAEEEKKTKAALLISKECNTTESMKLIEKERLKNEKALKDIQKSQERERLKLEKEKERERIKLEKEQKILFEQLAKEKEIKKQQEFAAEIEKTQLRQKEVEKEKELERERARLEREKIIAEREKAREEKLLAEAKKINEKQKNSSITSTNTTTKVLKDNETISALSNKNKSSSNNVSTQEQTNNSIPPVPPKWSSFLTQPTLLSPSSSTLSVNRKQLSSNSAIKAVNNLVPHDISEFPPLGENSIDTTITTLVNSSNSGFQKDAGYKQYVSSSTWGWADHERAMLEATAERIAVNKLSSDIPPSTSLPITSSVSITTESSITTSKIEHSNSYSSAYPGGSMESQHNDFLVSSSNSSISPEISPLMAKLGLSSSSSSTINKGLPSISRITASHSSPGIIDNDDSDINLLLSSSIDAALAAPDNFNVLNNSNNFSNFNLDPITSLHSNNSIPLNNDFNLSYDLDKSLNLSLNNLTQYNEKNSLSFSSLLKNNNNNISSNQQHELNNPFGINNINTSYNGGGIHDDFLNSTQNKNQGLHNTLQNNNNNNGLDLRLNTNTTDDFLKLLGDGSNNSYLGGSSGDTRSNLIGNNHLNIDLNSYSSTSTLGSSSLLQRTQQDTSDNSVFSSLLNYNNPLSHKGNNSYFNDNLLSSVNSDVTNNFHGFNSSSSNSNSSILYSGLGFSDQPSSNNLLNTNTNNSFFTIPSSSSNNNNFNLLNPLETSILGQSNSNSNTSSFLNSSLGISGISSSPLSSTPPPIPQLSSSSSNSNKGIDQDLVPEYEFPVVAWLRIYHMHVYRWAGNSSEWTEFAIHIPRTILPMFMNENGTLKLLVTEIMRHSGCRIWIESELLNDKQEKFMIFHKGSDGQPSHSAMLTAFELLSEVIKQWIILYGQVFRLTTTSNSKSNIYDSMINNNITQQSSHISLTSSALIASDIGNTCICPEYINIISTLTSNISKHVRPRLLKVSVLPGSSLNRYLEISKEIINLMILQSCKKIKDLCIESNTKIQFRLKTIDQDNKIGLLEIIGSSENVDKALQLIWDMLQMINKEYNEVSFHSNVVKTTK